jgi:hypothetical protein
MSGDIPPAGTPEYTRTWSMAIRITIAPRSRSTDCHLVVVVVVFIYDKVEKKINVSQSKRTNVFYIEGFRYL